MGDVFNFLTGIIFSPKRCCCRQQKIGVRKNCTTTVYTDKDAQYFIDILFFFYIIIYNI